MASSKEEKVPKDVEEGVVVDEGCWVDPKQDGTPHSCRISSLAFPGVSVPSNLESKVRSKIRGMDGKAEVNRDRTYRAGLDGRGGADPPRM